MKIKLKFKLKTEPAADGSTGVAPLPDQQHTQPVPQSLKRQHEGNTTSDGTISDPGTSVVTSTASGAAKRTAKRPHRESLKGVRSNDEYAPQHDASAAPSQHLPFNSNQAAVPGSSTPLGTSSLKRVKNETGASSLGQPTGPAHFHSASNGAPAGLADQAQASVHHPQLPQTSKSRPAETPAPKQARPSKVIKLEGPSTAATPLNSPLLILPVKTPATAAAGSTGTPSTGPKVGFKIKMKALPSQPPSSAAGVAPPLQHTYVPQSTASLQQLHHAQTPTRPVPSPAKGAAAKLAAPATVKKVAGAKPVNGAKRAKLTNTLPSPTGAPVVKLEKGPPSVKFTHAGLAGSNGIKTEGVLTQANPPSAFAAAANIVPSSFPQARPLPPTNPLDRPPSAPTALAGSGVARSLGIKLKLKSNSGSIPFAGRNLAFATDLAAGLARKPSNLAPGAAAAAVAAGPKKVTPGAAPLRFARLGPAPGALPARPLVPQPPPRQQDHPAEMEDLSFDSDGSSGPSTLTGAGGGAGAGGGYNSRPSGTGFGRGRGGTGGGRGRGRSRPIGANGEKRDWTPMEKVVQLLSKQDHMNVFQKPVTEAIVSVRILKETQGIVIESSRKLLHRNLK